MKRDRDVDEFIWRRFPENDHWTDGNCYWFAVILCVRFHGELWYDPIENHFIAKIGRKLYDHSGEYTPVEKAYSFKEYKELDPIEYRRILRDCVR